MSEPLGKISTYNSTLTHLDLLAQPVATYMLDCLSTVHPVVASKVCPYNVCKIVEVVINNLPRSQFLRAT